MESQHRPEPTRPDVPMGPSGSYPRFPINFKSLSIFTGLFAATVLTTWWIGGPWYSFGLMVILGTHEFGHYWACRRNNVNSSLPNFLPVPPLPYFLNIGTMGAFIMIKEPIPNRRALMEIGASGPIAGFLVALPVLIVGLMYSEVSMENTTPPEQGLFFGSSLILWGVTETVLGIDPTSSEILIQLHPLAYAGWFGIFFTALNLMPMGQLDGGHIVYSLFKPPMGLWVARLSFIALLTLGFWWLGWWVWCGLVLLLGLQHPPVVDESISLEPKHRLAGYFSIVLFIGAFIPVPFYGG